MAELMTSELYKVFMHGQSLVCICISTHFAGGLVAAISGAGGSTAVSAFFLASASLILFESSVYFTEVLVPQPLHGTILQ